MGIESVWAMSKKEYRKRIEKVWAKSQFMSNADHIQIVHDSINELDPDKIMACCQDGLDNIEEGLPI